jgi:alpha-L-fucosidase
VHGVSSVDKAVAAPSDEPWVRWTSGGGHRYAIVDATGPVHLSCDAAALELPAQATAEAGGVRVDIPAGGPAPAVVTFGIR